MRHLELWFCDQAALMLAPRSIVVRLRTSSNGVQFLYKPVGELYSYIVDSQWCCARSNPLYGDVLQIAEECTGDRLQAAVGCIEQATKASVVPWQLTIMIPRNCMIQGN